MSSFLLLLWLCLAASFIFIVVYINIYVRIEQKNTSKEKIHGDEIDDSIS